MAGYATGKANKPKEEEEEENVNDEPYWGKSHLGKIKRGEVTLGKGGEPGRVCNGASKQARGG